MYKCAVYTKKYIVVICTGNTNCIQTELIAPNKHDSLYSWYESHLQATKTCELQIDNQTLGYKKRRGEWIMNSWINGYEWLGL